MDTNNAQDAYRAGKAQGATAVEALDFARIISAMTTFTEMTNGPEWRAGTIPTSVVYFVRGSIMGAAAVIEAPKPPGRGIVEGREIVRAWLVAGGLIPVCGHTVSRDACDRCAA